MAFAWKKSVGSCLDRVSSVSNTRLRHFWQIRKVDVDGMSLILVRRDEKGQGVPTPTDVAEFPVLATHSPD